MTEALDADPVVTWGTLVHEPGTVLTKSGSVSLVFTPFHTRWEQRAWDPWPTIGPDADVTVLDDPGDGVPALDGEPPEDPGERGAAQCCMLTRDTCIRGYCVARHRVKGQISSSSVGHDTTRRLALCLNAGG